MKLLVCIDLSDSTEKIVKKIESLAKELSAEIWLLHVAEPEPDFVGFEVGPQSVRDSMSKIFHSEHLHIQEIADRLRKTGISATSLLVQGATVDTILKEASKLGVDMIIVGSHGHGAMYQLVVGSVCEGVLHKSTYPVLVIPSQEHT